MLKLNHGALRRTAGIGIAASLLAGGMLLAQPATAQEQPQTEKVEKIEKIEIRRHVIDGKDVADLPADARARLAKCESEAFEAEAGSAGAKNKTVIKLCSKPGASKAEIAAMLEKALSRIEGTTEMPAENKAEIISKLRARIAELRSGS